MKILQVSPRYAPRTGGVETQVQELSERLVKLGHEVTVVTGDAGEATDSRERRNGVFVRRHHGFSPGDTFHIAPGVVQSVRRTDADIVHGHNIHSLPLVFATVAANVPTVATPYYHGASSSKWRNLLWTGYRPVADWVLRQADTVTAVSEWERAALGDDLGVNPKVVPIGLDIEMFQTADPLPRERPYLLCVTRLEEYKGVQDVIRALPHLEEPKYDLMIAGDGPYREELRKIAHDTGVAERVKFLGLVDNHDLPAYYAGADVFLSLSTFESYGITVAEALASGTPCVVRHSTALSEWAKRPGCMSVSTVSPNHIAEAVVKAREQTPNVDSIPTWEYVVEQFLEIYEETVG